VDEDFGQLMLLREPQKSEQMPLMRMNATI
jgi:hypothetical protein